MDSNKDVEKLSNLIKSAREKKNLTQVQVAEKAGLNTNYYSVIERGETNPSYTTLKKIGEVLDIKLLPL